MQQNLNTCGITCAKTGIPQRNSATPVQDTLVLGGIVIVGLFGFEAVPNLLGARRVESAAENIDELSASREPVAKSETEITKNAPNPHGSRGGPAHRDTIEKRIAELKEQGHEHLNGGNKIEENIRTPGGNKSSRRPDITTRAPDGNIYRENVGRSTKAGEPISRELKALDDIEAATGERPGYTPYDR